MPAQESLGLDEESPPMLSAEEPTQSGEQCPIRWLERRADHLATEECHFVAEHDDFDG
jgi:hypothetical protein